MERCEAAIGLGVQFGSVSQEETCYIDTAPAAGTVKGRPPVNGVGVNL